MRRVALAVLAVVVALSGGDARARQDAPDPTWERIEPGGRTACARGGRYASDDVQELFYAAVGADPKGFEPRLRRAEEALKRLPNYRSYLACGGDHCVLPRESFFSLRVDGVAIRSWVQALAAGRDVVRPECP